VLLNGRRAGPAGTRGQVSAFDLNVIPQAAVERYEILKDGASSIYGSDAIAGVVNIITKKSTEGIELNTFASQPEEGGGEEYDINGDWGKTFDRGYIMVSGDWYKRRELKKGQREYLDCNESYFFNANGRGRADLIDPRTNRFKCQNTAFNQVFLYDYDPGISPGNNTRGGRLQFDGTGQIGTLSPGSILPPPADAGDLVAPPNFFLVDADADPLTFAVADNYNRRLEKDADVQPEIERFTLFANGAYDINSDIQAYGEVLFNRRETKTNGFRQVFSYLFTYDYGTATGQGAFGDPFSVGWLGPWILSPTILTDLAGDSKQTVDYWRVVGGLRGKLSVSFLHDWDWDLYFQYSRSDGDYDDKIILQDAMDLQDFRTGSCVGQVTPISQRQCVDVLWLSPDRLQNGAFTPEEAAFLFATDHGNTTYTQKYVEGSVTGNLFNLPAGPLGVALGFQFRKEEIDDVPGVNARNNNSWGFTSSGITRGDDTIKEVFGELQIPILKDYPIAQDLNLAMSGRWTDYDSFGSDTTYKLGLNWKVNPVVLVRATKGTSFRAPALFELFLANQTGFLGQRQIDPCINYQLPGVPDRVRQNCAAEGIPVGYSPVGAGALIITGGNAGELKAETSDAWTVGLALTPKFADLSIALDYFDITIDDEVTQLGANNILFGCYNSEHFPDDPLCDLFTRAPNFLVTQVVDNFINIATQKDRGLDLTTRYRRDLPWELGRLTLTQQATWTFENKVELFPGTVTDNNGNVNFPDFVANMEARVDRGDWTFFWAMNFIGKASAAEQLGTDTITQPFPNPPGLPPDPESDPASPTFTYHAKVYTEFTSYHTLSVQKKFDGWTVLGGVANIFDEHPPAVTAGTGQFGTVGRSVLSSQYDYVGRRFFLSVKKQF
jgi:iron complex outermembrane receptor protein